MLPQQNRHQRFARKQYCFLVERAFPLGHLIVLQQKTTPPVSPPPPQGERVALSGVTLPSYTEACRGICCGSGFTHFRLEGLARRLSLRGLKPDLEKNESAAR